MTDAGRSGIFYVYRCFRFIFDGPQLHNSANAFCRYHTLYRRLRTRNIHARVRADSAAELLHELRDAATKSRDKAAARVANVAAAAYRLRQQHTI